MSAGANPVARAAAPRRLAGDAPGLGWWVLLAAALAMHFTLTLGWAAGLGLLVFVLLQRYKPLDFMSSYLIVVAGASLINYSRGFLTFELSILTTGIVFMLFCFALQQRGRTLTLVHSPMSAPLLLYLGLSIVNFVRGLLIGNSGRYAGLELIAALGLGGALLVATRTMDERRVRMLVIWLWCLCFVHMCLGLWAYATIKVRVSAIYFTPVPGIVFALLLNFALRGRTTARSMLGMVLLTPLLLHQFLSFTRGFWFAAIGSTIFSVLMYTGRGPGVAERWRRTGVGLGVFVAIAAVVSVVVAATIGIQDIAESAGSRFASSTGTQMSWETASNIVRLSEYFHVIDLVLEQPWIGYGLGYSFTIREPIGWRLIHQWFVHQNYLLVWFKQGLPGLLLFVAVLWGAFRTGWQGRRLEEGWQRAWCMGAAAATVWLAIYSMVHFPLAEVNSVFTAALIWGTAIAITKTRSTVLWWRTPPEAARGAPGGADGQRPPGA